MAKINRFFILLTAFFLLANTVHGFSFNVHVNPIKDKIVVDEVAEYDISIKNLLDTDEEFLIKKAGYPYWDMYITPIQNPITLNVPAKSSASIRLFVDPLYITSVDTYTLDVAVVLSRTNEELSVPITVGIKSTGPLIEGYVPTVLANVGIIPEQVDPREPFVIKVMLSNQNPINYSNLTIRIESNQFNEELYVPLGPNEEKVFELPKDLDDKLPPQENELVVSVYKNDRKIVNPVSLKFIVKEYSIVEDIPKEESFLKIKKRVRIMSNNPSYKSIIKVETNQFKNLFTSTYPRAQYLKENDRRYLVWEVGLDENLTATL